MEKWTRWQAWVALLAGAYGALSPLWTPTDRTATWTMAVLGVVTVMVALVAMSEERFSGYALGLVGLVFVASPWMLGFEGLTAMARTAWLVGAAAFIAGVLAMPQVEARAHMHHRPIAH